jgi:SAM-dependent methyltransferase
MAYFDPTERGVEETARFLSGALPRPPCRVLEVGCGSGAVAARLQAQGWTMAGIDIAPDAATAARERGIETVQGDFLTYRGGPFDAVVFTRSLHHLESVGEAVERAHAMLRPGGMVLAEEFAVERMDVETARWFYELTSLLETCGVMTPDLEGEATMAASQLDRWFQEHEAHAPVHTGEELMIALGSRFDIQSTRSAPYLYRRVGRLLAPTSLGVRVANWVFEVESMRIAQMTLKPVGLRVLGRRR